jgi:outer membrane cobalamin receptor
MNPKIDINLGSTYTFNKTFSAFAQLNNLLNSKYQEFYGYEVQGLNFMLGGAVSF